MVKCPSAPLSVFLPSAWTRVTGELDGPPGGVVVALAGARGEQRVLALGEDNTVSWTVT